MRIDEIGPDNPITNPQRREEVLRLARSLAAERFASAHAVHASQVPQTAGREDVMELSEEAVDELAGRNDVNDLRRTDQIVVALKEAFENISHEPSRRDRSSRSLLERKSA